MHDTYHWHWLVYNTYIQLTYNSYTLILWSRYKINGVNTGKYYALLALMAANLS